MDVDQENALGRSVIGHAIEVHRHLGPGLLETAYQECFCFEPRHAGISHARTKNSRFAARVMIWTVRTRWTS